MADDVVVPIGAPKTVATRELAGGRHAQEVILAATRLNLVASIAPATSGGYAIGEQIGPMVKLASVPSGIYQVESASLIDPTGTVTVPEFMVYGYALDAGATPPAFPGDADPLVPDISGALGSLVIVPPTTWVFEPLPGFDSFLYASPSNPDQRLLITSTGLGSTVDLYVAPIAAAVTAEDMTGGLAMTMQMAYRGSVNDVATVFGS